MDSIPISIQGYELVKEKLDDLKRQRPEVSKAIGEAREEGDLKENAGYHAARERQGWIEAQIRFIESRMPSFNVIDLDTLDGETVTYGATVEIEDVETGESKLYTILGPDETDYVKGSISILAPVARALLGKEEGDEVLVDIPKGKVEYEITSVVFKGAKELFGE
ncbi:MAG: transcription elongation factor GreA [Desulfovibrio sp.]|uniref:transcription elongation factor GreA n=1 Tax=Desulfovibrio sp. 7SRBS1 TaxID=3378064 RepID=UPI003B3DE08E